MSLSRPTYIAIEGVIGAGKTTLAQLLQADFGATLVLEAFDENPFLPLFYEDPQRYAFQTQVFFLLSRYHQQRAIREVAGTLPLITDYLFAKDQLFARLKLRGHEWDTYKSLHDVLEERIIAPDLVIYLRATVDTLMARIRRRDRPYERQMERAYIASLVESYQAFFAEYHTAPLLVVETDSLNVVDLPEDLERVRQRVAEALRPAAHATSPGAP